MSGTRLVWHQCSLSISALVCRKCATVVDILYSCVRRKTLQRTVYLYLTFVGIYDLSWINVHTYAVYSTLLYLSSLQCPRPLSPPSCCSQWAAETRSEQPLSGAHYIGAVPETSSYHAGRIGSSLPWISCTIVLQKSAHGRSTLQVCQRVGWALFRMVLHLTMKEHLSHVYSNYRSARSR